MSSSRRSFIKTTASTTTAAAVGLIPFTDVATEQQHVNEDVSKSTGPHGVGLPITVAGYEYSRVRALIEGQVPIDATVGYSSSGLTHVRGILEEEYGVKPNEIEWISTQKDSAANQTGGVSKWEKIRPEGTSITDAPANEDESSLLISGQVDAIFHPAEPKVYQERNPLVDRLFTDHRTVERDFFKRTGIFPIMHTIAIRKKSIERNPTLPRAVFEAYSKAKALDYDRMRQWGWVKDSLPWYGQEFNETRELMGENFYAYGLKACAASYEMATRFVYDQGLSKRKVSLEEMFELSSLDFEETF